MTVTWEHLPKIAGRKCHSPDVVEQRDTLDAEFRKLNQRRQAYDTERQRILDITPEDADLEDLQASQSLRGTLLTLLKDELSLRARLPDFLDKYMEDRQQIHKELYRKACEIRREIIQKLEDIGHKKIRDVADFDALIPAFSPAYPGLGVLTCNLNVAELHREKGDLKRANQQSIDNVREQIQKLIRSAVLA